MPTLRFISVLIAASAASVADAQQFRDVKLGAEGSKLWIERADGQTLPAPLMAPQDGFDKPAISRNGRYAGWLALYPNMGASYSQPLHLTVLSDSGRIQTFRGEWGMVYDWCFTSDNTAAVFRYQFPHGTSDNGFDKVRLKDGKLLARTVIKTAAADGKNNAVNRAKLPPWTKCTAADTAK